MTRTTGDFGLSTIRELAITLENAEQVEAIEKATSLDFLYDDGEYESNYFNVESLEELKEIAQECVNESDGDEFVKNVFDAIIEKYGEFESFRFYYSA